MPLIFVKQDITAMSVDAVVNAANGSLAMGGGVCGAIFRAAGANQLTVACNALAPIKTGEAVITPGFNMDADYIIHAVGPVYSKEYEKECEKYLRLSYLNSLKLAEANNCHSIAFPLISSGIFGYPKAKAFSVAVDAIRSFLENSNIEVYLSVFDKAAVNQNTELTDALERYIDNNYQQEFAAFSRAPEHSRTADADFVYQYTVPAGEGLSADIGDLLENLDEPFSAVLLRMIDEKGKTDVEVYKKANLDRRLFSKIRTAKNNYTPGKNTVLALAVSLELSLKETESLLKCAGYSLSHSWKADVIVEYFIINKRYDIFEINEVLFSYDLPLLGCYVPLSNRHDDF